MFMSVPTPWNLQTLYCTLSGVVEHCIATIAPSGVHSNLDVLSKLLSQSAEAFVMALRRKQQFLAVVPLVIHKH
jgi:hypothetical protein